MHVRASPTSSHFRLTVWYLGGRETYCSFPQGFLDEELDEGDGCNYVLQNAINFVLGEKMELNTKVYI